MKNMFATLALKPAVAVLAVSANLIACGGGSSTDNSTDNNSDIPSQLETNSRVAANFIDNLAIPAYTDFANKAGDLSGTLQTYCNTLSQENNTETTTALNSAQSAWLALKNDWQASRVYEVGPLADNGGNLARRIYTANNFDSSTQIFIANEVAKRKADNSYIITPNITFKARGLDALEYLLYSSEQDLTKQKDNCLYAVAVAQDVKVGADDIVNMWADEATRKDLLEPATSNAVDLISPFFDNVVTVADKIVKDAGLGEPLALKSDGTCSQDACPELVENRLSQTTYDSLKANIAGINALFTGNGGEGFAIYFEQNGLSDEATNFAQMLSDTSAALTQNRSLLTQVSNINTAQRGAACQTVSTTGDTTDTDLAACAAYYHVKQLSDDVKTGAFKLAINLDLPAAAAGDGD